jgi:hypothetical protein
MYNYKRCVFYREYTSTPTQHKANNNIELAHERECQHRSTTTKNHTDRRLQITTKSASDFNSDKWHFNIMNHFK